MKKAWVLFALVLLILLQLSALSSFHQFQAWGPAFGTTDVCVAMWDYVQATVQVQVMGTPFGAAEVTLPNGTRFVVPPDTTANFTLSLPKTGDFFGSAGASIGTTEITQSQPIVATVDANVTSFPSYCQLTGGVPNLDVTTIVVVGNATVSLTGYGVAL